MDRFETFSLALFSISRCWSKIAGEEMKRFGLKGVHAFYLVTILSHDGVLTAANLCELCGRDKADVSRDLRQLERAGLISRGKGYRACVTLTEQGKALAEQIIRKAEYAVGFVGGSLSESEREIFSSVLDRISANMRRLSEIGLD